MNKQLEEGKRLAKDVDDYMILDAETIAFMKHHTPDYLIGLYTHIEKLEAENKRFREAIEKVLPVMDLTTAEFEELRLASTLPHELDTCKIILKEALKESE